MQYECNGSADILTNLLIIDYDIMNCILEYRVCSDEGRGTESRNIEGLAWFIKETLFCSNSSQILANGMCLCPLLTRS